MLLNRLRRVFLALITGMATLAQTHAATEPVAAPSTRVYLAREVITMNPQQPRAEAIAVIGERIVGVGSFEQMLILADGDESGIDSRFEDKVIVPGFIEPHIHPILSALTLTSKIISIEDWTLPDGSTSAAVRDRATYLKRLGQAEAALSNENELLLSWGFHHYFHGRLTRKDLDAISSQRPIVIWHRSAHEFILNSRALELIQVDAAALAEASELAQKQSDLAAGHFWEAGALDFLSQRLLPLISANTLKGLNITERYLHSAGVTTSAEPGGLAGFYKAMTAVLGDAATPFRFFYIPDGRGLAAKYSSEALLNATLAAQTGAGGNTAFLPMQVKLFADGAIYSQLMQMREGYLDGHHGEWMMEEGDFRNAFRTYWDAGYQIHVHQNGDSGLDRVIDVLAQNMKRNPREDHRTTIVHFGFSTAKQVVRLAELGAIVSANPYYTTALADKYSEVGVGPERALQMVRLGDVVEAGIPLALHSDMPMAPARPLYLMWAAVTRSTFSGKVAAKNLAISVEDALRAVTIDAAYSLRLEDEIGSIEPGKRADFTVLDESPFEVPAADLKNIPIWGTVSGGREFPL